MSEPIRSPLTRNGQKAADTVLRSPQHYRALEVMREAALHPDRRSMEVKSTGTGIHGCMIIVDTSPVSVVSLNVTTSELKELRELFDPTDEFTLKSVLRASMTIYAS